MWQPPLLLVGEHLALLESGVDDEFCVAVLPDEYFTPTAADLRAAQSQLAARTQALTNAPLRLKTAREAEDKAKRDRWPNVRSP